MIPYERQEMIHGLLLKDNIFSIDKIMEKLPDVSESTIRRDLQTLANSGRVELLHGGGVKLRAASELHDFPLEKKLARNTNAKQVISRLAAELIQEGDVVYLDSSTTVFHMLKYLEHKNITIVTSGTHLADRLRNYNVKCIIIGGEVKQAFGSIVGPMTEEMLSKMYFDKAFMGANGYSKEQGITTPHFEEAAKIKMVAKNSQEFYMTIDSSKEGVKSLYKIFDLKDCNIITEKYSDILLEFKSYICG